MRTWSVVRPMGATVVCVTAARSAREDPVFSMPARGRSVAPTAAEGHAGLVPLATLVMSKVSASVFPTVPARTVATTVAAGTAESATRRPKLVPMVCVCVRRTATV